MVLSLLLVNQGLADMICGLRELDVASPLGTRITPEEI